MREIFSLKGKVALVTGCGSIGDGWGNGKAIATLFARQGARIYGVDINYEAAKETADIIRSEGNIIEISQCDVTNARQVEKMASDCLAKYGKIDILCNVVGKSEPGDPASMSETTWDAQMDVNLKSVYLCCHTILPIMETQGHGVILNVSSIAGLRYVGKPQVAYAALKAAIIQFTKTTAVIYADKGIRLNTVVPGLVFTPLVKRLADKYANGNFDSFVATRHAQVPMQRMGDAWDIAYGSLYLVSDEAKYVTATELVIDGGITASTGFPKL